MAFALLYLLCFFLFMILPCSIVAQSSGNVSLGSSLTALNDDNSSWTSPSGDFAFGFRRIGKDAFLLAIWFNKIPDRTTVWSANRDNLVQQRSQCVLTSEGQLILNDATGKQIWYANSVDTEVSYAAMLDSGNFVLANRMSVNLWESFDEPTDTILPTQTIKRGTILFARYTATNYSRGRFVFTLQSDGNLLLYTTRFPQLQEEGITSYYASMTLDTGFQVIFNKSGSIYLTARNGSILKMVSSNTVSMQNLYQQASLEHDGVLRHSVHPKTAASSAGRPMAWSLSQPWNICLLIQGETGSGACGYNSICSYDDQGPTCQCPYGYTFIDPSDVLKGCKQSCDEAFQKEKFLVVTETQMVYHVF